ncbi:MAG TPA: tetratricopeptide repeat protein [Candidatus Eisenbacteria bacterium]|nr:tetratricopeptide repeat protein [Candidatus Eisenbacteria bacterium]
MSPSAGPKTRGRRSAPARPAARPKAGSVEYLWLAAILAVTFVAYLPSLGNGFTNWDDPLYVLQNPLLTHPTVGAILATPVAGNWHPLTIGSYVLNYRISGLDPVSYHWLNLLLHLANTALVFLFVGALAPGRKWTVVLTSLFFGIHPMHVESVAWIAERKDVLYAFFYLAGLLAYLRYLKAFQGAWLVASLAAFALSIASKPAAIVFPLALAAIDFYRRRSLDARSLLEKVPFLAISAAVLVITLRVQESAGAINRMDIGPVFPRVLVACFGVMMYVVKAIAPSRLSAMYPYPKDPATSLGPEFYLGLVFVAAFATVVYLGRRNRALVFGSAFFLIHLVLVLQFVSVGKVVMADRYTYIPYVGLFFALTWALDEPQAASRFRMTRYALAGMFLLLIPVSLIQTWNRCHVWRDSGTLWTDVIRQYPGRIYDAYNNRGKYYFDTGRYAEALADYDQALALDPKPGRAYFAKGSALGRLGRIDEALACFDRALELDPTLAEARSDRAGVRLMKGDMAGAIADLDVAIKLNPGFRGSYVNRGSAYVMTGDLDRAVADYRHAIEMDPHHPKVYELWGAMGDALVGLNRPQEAVTAYDQAIPLAPSTDSQRGELYRGRSRAWLALGESENAARDAAEAKRYGVKVE